MLIPRTLIVVEWLAVLLLCQFPVLGDELLRDDFDRYNPQTWGAKPGAAEIVFRNELNQTNGAVRLRPKEGSCHIFSDEQFRRASIEFEVKANTLSRDSSIFYYFGFHNTQPWTQDLLWLVVQDNAIKLQAKENGGRPYERQLGEMPVGKWVKIALIRNGKQVTVRMDGKTVADFSAPEVSDRPMSAFFGANTIRGATMADLQVDGVQIDGDAKAQAADLRPPRQLSQDERRLAAKREAFSGPGWKTAMADGVITLSSPAVSYAFSVKDGLCWKAIDRFSASGTIPGLKPGSAAAIYAVKVGDRELDSRDLPLTKVVLSAARPRLEMVQADAQAGLKAEVAAELKSDGSLVLSLRLTNQSASAQPVRPTFPLLQNLEIAGDLDGLGYFFPWRGGLMGTVPCNLATEYGTLGWMQVMAAFNAKARSGIFFFPEDATGMLKGLMLKKTVKGGQDKVNFNEIVHPADLPTLNLAPADGLGMACYYPARSLAPGAAMTLPTTRLKAYAGDWREPLQEYVAWTKGWYRPLPKPRWFQDSYTFLNQHPPSYYDQETKNYKGAKALQGSESVAQWAMWESLKVPYAWSGFNGSPDYQPGDFVPAIARGGLKSFKQEIAAYHQKGTRFTPYINYRFCLRASEVGTRHEDWAAIANPGGDYHTPPFPKEILCMCFYDRDKWASFLAASCQRLVKDSGMDGVYLDELAIQQPCYNPLHEHLRNGPRQTSTKRLAENLAMVRNAMKAANPDAILMTEHAGSDYLTQFIDGSWDQTFCQAFPFAEQYYDANRLCYFRFCFPSFKLAEWGMSKRHVNRYFFNGMGWDFGAGDTALSRVLGNTLKETSDAISTGTPEPLVPTSHAQLLANRFNAPDKVVYTLYNVHDQPITGFIAEAAPFAGHYVELVDDEELGGGPAGTLALTIPPETVKGVALLKNILQASVSGENVSVSVPAAFRQADLRVYPDLDDSQLLVSKGVKINLRDGQAKFAIGQTFATRPRRVILKLCQDGYLVDERVLKGP
jgi:hypothetical protein